MNHENLQQTVEEEKSEFKITHSIQWEGRLCFVTTLLGSWIIIG